ncbi:MAG: PPC domain-containing DNA-binding protein [Methanoregula sp.]|jgi:hypothetical protein
MQYSEGRIGRGFVVRIDDGEDFLATVTDFVTKKEIRTGTILFLGALREARMVTGPEEPVYPPDPHFVMFDDGWEMVGIGSICSGKDGSPALHFHASVGKAGHALAGCLRESATVYIVAEAIILEIAGPDIRRMFDEKTKVNLPVHGRQVPAPDPGTRDMKTRAEQPQTNAADDDDQASGGLAEIIRDLTQRPRV